MIRSCNLLAATLLLCGSLLPACALAQTTAADGILQGFSRCRAIAAPDARLACFDAATSALEGAVRSKAITIVDRQEMRAARRSLFGFTLPRIGLFGGHDESGSDVSELSTTITRAIPQANGRVELRLADGDAAWTTTDPMPFPPRAGASIRIRRGALGNYFLAIDGQRSVRGIRLR